MPTIEEVKDKTYIAGNGTVINMLRFITSIHLVDNPKKFDCNIR